MKIKARWFLVVLSALLTPCLAAFIGMNVRLISNGSNLPTPPAYQGQIPSSVAHNPSKPTAVIIAANKGTEGSDFLAPYDILGRSGKLNVYAVAPQQQITHLFPGSPLLRGIDFMPHFSFASYDEQIGQNPDVIVIPYLPFQQEPEYMQIVEWIRSHAGPNTLLVSICAGAQTLADTGLLDGHKATTHHYTFAQLAANYPSIELIRDVRYVEDGNLISSAGVTASVDASLLVLKRLFGRDVAFEVAEQVQYPYTAFIDQPSHVLEAMPLGNTGQLVPPLVNQMLSGYKVGNDNLGIALYEGMSEIALASVADTYAHSGALTLHGIAPERTVIRTQHDLWLIPSSDFQQAPKLDRLIFPGAADASSFEAWSQARGLEFWRAHRDGEYAYTTTFHDMAQQYGSLLTNQAIYMLEYPLGHVAVDSKPVSVGLVLNILLWIFLGALFPSFGFIRYWLQGKRRATA